MKEKANTPLEQIYLNTKAIKELKEDIAPVYKSNVNLGALANAVDVADTNLTTDVTKAFIVDFNGNYYKFIAFNEDKTKAYIEYYANVKGEKGDTGETGAQGPQGEQGPAGRDGADDIDDNTTANNKLWSSQKTNTEIGKAKDKGVYYTTTQPTSDTTLAISNIGNINNDIAIKANDLIIYINNDNPTSIYFVVSVGETNLMVSKIADFASGGGGVEGGNVWHTWTRANFIDGEATFSIGNIVKPNDIPLNIADKILYVDDNDNIIECYMIDDIGDISVTLEKIGNVGKQLYNYTINYRNVGNNQLLSIQFISSENFESVNDFYTYLENNDFTSTSNLFYFNGGHYNGSPCYCVYNDGNLHFGYCANGASSISYILIALTSMTLTKQNI